MRFLDGSVPISVVARVYGKDQNWVRRGIVAGWLPIGVATQGGQQVTDISKPGREFGRTNFDVSPKKLYEETGFLWRGEQQ